MKTSGGGRRNGQARSNREVPMRSCLAILIMVFAGSPASAQADPQIAPEDIDDIDQMVEILDDADGHVTVA